MFKNLAKTLFGDPSEREAKRLQPLVDQINALGPEFERMSDEDLRAQTDAFREIRRVNLAVPALNYGETLEEALNREAREELGIAGFNAQFVEKYIWETEVEKELVFIFLCQTNQNISQ